MNVRWDESADFIYLLKNRNSENLVYGIISALLTNPTWHILRFLIKRTSIWNSTYSKFYYFLHLVLAKRPRSDKFYYFLRLTEYWIFKKSMLFH